MIAALHNLNLRRIPHEKTRPWRQFYLGDCIMPNLWQKNLLKEMKNIDEELLRRVLVIAPSGSGKSMALTLMASEHPHRKHVFITSRRGIAHGFCGGPRGVRLRVDGNNFSWQIADWNLCENSSPVKALKKFLLRDANDFIDAYPDVLGDRACCTTHASMAKLWKRLDPVSKHKVLENTTFYMDECHHATADEITEIGMFLSEIIKTDVKSCRIVLATATFFRGDYRDIITEEDWARFYRFVLPFDDYLDMVGIKGIDINCVQYRTGGDPLNEIVERIKKEPQKRHLILIPPRNSRFRSGDLGDLEPVRRIVSGLEGFVPRDHILDLVKESTQVSNLNKLYDDPEAWHVVVSCKLVDEGIDWPPCNVIHNSDPTNSQSREAQVLGRSLRRYESKSSVCCNIYVPRRVSGEEGIDREVYTDRLNVLLIYLLVTDNFCPIKMPLLPTAGRMVSMIGTSTQVTLRDVLTTDQSNEIVEKIVTSIDLMDRRDKESVRRRLERIAKDFYRKFKLGSIVSADHFKNYIERIAFRINRIQTGKNPIDPSFVREEGFDKMWKMSPICGCLIFGTPQPLQGEDYKALRGIIERKTGMLKRVEEITDFFETFPRSFPDVVKAPIKKKIDAGSWVAFNVEKTTNYARVTEDRGDIVQASVYRGLICFDSIRHEVTHTIQNRNGRDVLINFGGEDWCPNLPGSPQTIFEAPARHRHLFRKNRDISREAELKREWILGIVPTNRRE